MEKYLGEEVVSSLKSKYKELDTAIKANTALIGDVDTLLKQFDTGSGV